MEIDEKEITKKLSRLEDREDEINAFARKFQREEQEEEEEIFKAMSSVEEMRECCSANDFELQNLLDEKRYLLDKLREQKNEFTDEFHAKIRTEKRNIELKKEELRNQLKGKQEQNDEIKDERYNI